MKIKSRPCKRVNVVTRATNDLLSNISTIVEGDAPGCDVVSVSGIDDSDVLMEGNSGGCDVMHERGVDDSGVFGVQQVRRKRSSDDLLERIIPPSKRYKGNTTHYKSSVCHSERPSVVSVNDDDCVTREQCRQVFVGGGLKRKFVFGNSSSDGQSESEHDVNTKKNVVVLLLWRRGVMKLLWYVCLNFPLLL